MSTAVAIIGANYGDEGKGLATDYFARVHSRSGRAPLVVRCNGGAQAGHTVVAGDNRHVFGHIGSGTLAGSSTYLSSKFIVNPKVFLKEWRAMLALGLKPKVFGSRQCRVTTLYDMAMNSLAELKRGAGAHGSCGLGINETVTRHKAGYFITLGQIRDRDNRNFEEVGDYLFKIRQEWVPARLKELQIFPEQFEGADAKRAQLYYSMFDVDPMLIAAELVNDSRMIRMEDPKFLNDFSQELVVEGAQGLMLDEFLGKFPHVTRSVTGLASSIAGAYECGYTTIQPVYITRAYLTRHGNGPLANEGEAITNQPLHDSTNVPNQWQGALRYAPLNLDDLKTFIELDYLRGQASSHITSTTIGEPMIFLTCMDQLANNVQIQINNTLEIVAAENLPKIIEKHLNMKVPFTSYGPRASDVRFTNYMV